MDKDTQAAREMVKQMSPGKKFKYYLGYYKFYVLAAIIVLVAAASLLNTMINKKTPALYLGVLDGTQINSQRIIDDLTERLELKAGETITVFSNLSVKADENAEGYYNSMTIYIAANHLDIVFADEEGVTYLGKSGALRDVSEYLSGDLASVYESRITQFEALSEGNGMSEGDSFSLQNVAVDLTGTKAIEALGLSDKTCYMVVIANSERTEQIQAFMDYLYELETSD
ncbi:MAG: hypothetical protein K6F92_02310 [Lachnospiraceae bacterium]|nr:hypothetical protein [Lachnospiraceae bacterium]